VNGLAPLIERWEKQVSTWRWTEVRKSKVEFTTERKVEKKNMLAIDTGGSWNEHGGN
jgi:hypothetical protein